MKEYIINLNKISGILISILVFFISIESIYGLDQKKYLSSSRSSPLNEISAFWIDSQHMTVQISNSLVSKNSLHFFLRDQESPRLLDIELMVLSVEKDRFILNTSSIPLAQQKLLMSRALVLDVMSEQVLVQRTGIAKTTILDDLFFTDTNLGQIWSNTGVTIKIWSPTARKMILHLFTHADSETPAFSLPMKLEEGVWSLQLTNEFKGFYYQLEVENYFPELQNFQNLRVTDPYSPGLSADGQKTFLIDLDDPLTKPPGWDDYQLPAPVKIINSVIYENHIRDLTAKDTMISEEARGKYIGLADESSLAYLHLKDLKNAGVTHLHLLPFYDFGSVPELKINQQSLPQQSWNYPDEIPKALERIRFKDNYNWGYDPVHWLCPEGSYSTNPNGAFRIFEIRKMIQSLHKLNLHITQDVVFNHTYKSDFSSQSVLNKLVPSYFYRMDSKGVISSTSCCADTASENRMMEKLMSDSLKSWMKYYHITSFRFDLMSFHSRETMMRLRDMIKSELKKNFYYPPDSILIYGEAWAFGSLVDRHPELAMTQFNSYGTGIGIFNDRLRDSLRGGTTNLAELSDQGFITGLLDHFNFSNRNRNSPVNENDRLEKFLHLKDVVKIGLAGNLRDFSFKEHWGSLQTGGNIFFRGSPVAYAKSTNETINYISAHDGTTLWDALLAKLPYQSEFSKPETAPLWERVRRHQLALSFILFSQGIPFIEGGSEILRSKNGDADSYDSGDFYNALNFNLLNNNQNNSLPPAWINLSEWGFWGARLSDQSLQPQVKDKQETLRLFKTLLKIRKKHNAFKMTDVKDIQINLSFLDATNDTDPALLPLLLTSSVTHVSDERILIVWNTSRTEKIWSHPVLKTNNWQIEPEFNSEIIPWLQDFSLENSNLKLPPLSFIVLVQQNGHHE